MRFLVLFLVLVISVMGAFTFELKGMIVLVAALASLLSFAGAAIRLNEHIKDKHSETTVMPAHAGIWLSIKNHLRAFSKQESVLRSDPVAFGLTCSMLGTLIVAIGALAGATRF